MLEVDIEKIIPITEARDSFNQIIEGVEASDDMYVVTKNGKPSAIIVGVHHLEKLTGAELPAESFATEPTATAAAATVTTTKDTEDTDTMPIQNLSSTSEMTAAASPVSIDNDIDLAPESAPLEKVISDAPAMPASDSKPWASIASTPVAQPSVSTADTEIEDDLSDDIFGSSTDDLPSLPIAPVPTAQAISATPPAPTPVAVPAPTPLTTTPSNSLAAAAPQDNSATPIAPAPQNPPTTSI